MWELEPLNKPHLIIQRKGEEILVKYSLLKNKASMVLVPSLTALLLIQGFQEVNSTL